MGWSASLPYIRKIHVSVAIGTQSGIRLHERVPMVKIWGSSPKLDYRKVVKILKVHFHYSSSILLLVVVVVVVVLLLLLLLLLLLQFRLAYLNNQTELRHETLCTDRYP